MVNAFAHVPTAGGRRLVAAIPIEQNAERRLQHSLFDPKGGTAKYDRHGRGRYRRLAELHDQSSPIEMRVTTAEFTPS
jgi:hypothetical protein